MKKSIEANQLGHHLAAKVKGELWSKKAGEVRIYLLPGHIVIKPGQPVTFFRGDRWYHGLIGPKEVANAVEWANDNYSVTSCLTPEQVAANYRKNIDDFNEILRQSTIKRAISDNPFPLLTDPPELP